MNACFSLKWLRLIRRIEYQLQDWIETKPVVLILVPVPPSLAAVREEGTKQQAPY